MIKYEENMRDITRNLSWFVSNVNIRNSLGLYDISVYAERLFCGLINRMFGLHLVNVNQENPNYPSIDLADMDARVAVQITSIAAREKINHTLSQFFKHGLDQQFDVLHIVVISNEKVRFRNQTFHHPDLETHDFRFEPSEHIWDMARMIDKISALSEEKVGEIARYLNAQTGSCARAPGAQKDVSDDPSISSVEKLLQEAVQKLEELKTQRAVVDQSKQSQVQAAYATKKLESVLQKMEENLDNSKESDWHGIFSENEWVLAQIFDHPHIKLKEKAYVGGKDLDNHNGNECDFIYQNCKSENVVLIEIKNPCAPIIGHQYRGAYGLSHELTGAINQVLNYRDHLVKEYYATVCKTAESFQVINPRCIVIIGKMSSMDMDQVATFENFRNALNNVTIMTFDEICQRTRHLLSMLS